MSFQLYHVSEDPNIREFLPMPAPNPEAGVTGNAVWAISEKELPNYLLPRECPRVCYRDQAGAKTIAVEEGWVGALEKTNLCIYVFGSESFEEHDPIAGYWISREPVVPKKIIKIDSPLLELTKRELTLKILPHLHDEKDFAVNNFEHFSIIRFRNAQPRDC